MGPPTRTEPLASSKKDHGRKQIPELEKVSTTSSETLEKSWDEVSEASEPWTFFTWAGEKAHIAANQLVETIELDERVQTVKTGASNGLEVVSYVADVVKEGASIATTRLQVRVSEGVERAKTLDWAEHASGLQRELSERASETYETVTESASSAGASLHEKSSASLQAIREAESVQNFRESATSAAGAASSRLSIASESVSTALTISPRRWTQFLGIFGIGVACIFSSLTSLPLLLVVPERFAMLFTFGSLVILGSFAVFSGPKALAKQMVRSDRLPFSCAYVVGLIGTLVATLYFQSYVFTAVFALIQAVALLYFVASYLPGGRSTVNAFFRLSGRSVRHLVLT